MPGALHGVKVLEIAQVMAIPITGMLLSDMGADVVKLEPPWGDASRYTMQPVLPGDASRATGADSKEISQTPRVLLPSSRSDRGTPVGV